MVRLSRKKLTWSVLPWKRWCCSKLVWLSSQQIALYFILLDVFSPIEACCWLFFLFFSAIFTKTSVIIGWEEDFRFEVYLVLFGGKSHDPILYCLSSFELSSESIVIERGVHICHFVTDSAILFLHFSVSFLHERTLNWCFCSGRLWNRTLDWWFSIVQSVQQFQIFPCNVIMTIVYFVSEGRELCLFETFEVVDASSIKGEVGLPRVHDLFQFASMLIVVTSDKECWYCLLK